jgi:predicted nucleic acid-binding protein
MSLAYLDTSAAMKLLFEERESADLVAYLEGRPSGDPLVGSWLLHTELHCAAGRRGGIPTETLSAVLAVVDLVDLVRGDLLAAGTHAPLRAQDAIHLAVALRVGSDEIITYDTELAGAAARAGLRVVRPGAGE